VISLEEKPATSKSRFAIPGLYVYDSDVTSIAAAMTPSARGELEVTDVNRAYLERGALQVHLFDRGVAWLDSGTHDSLLEAANFIATIERRQSIKIGCLEEIALAQGFIDRPAFRRLIGSMPESPYRDYLESLLGEV
jgi:glucose-1-phosphate thymidylyltransferase